MLKTGGGKQRDSNIELVRIVAMLFIVIGHIIGHGMHEELSCSNNIFTVTVTGVNLFVMISGFFHIHLSWKSLTQLFGMVLFYGIISMVCAELFFGKITPTKDWIFPAPFAFSALFPMSIKGYYWFISCYFMLMLLSPFINTVLDNSTKKQHILLMFVLIYISCVSGWFFNNGINNNGYNTFHFVTIYVIGDFLKRYNIAKKLKSYKWFLFYVVITVVFPIITQNHPSKTLRYNNPFIIAASIALFNVFSNIKLQSKTVNQIARSMFPTYLIQEGALGLCLYNLLYLFGVQDKQHWIILLYFIGLFATAIIIEPIRNKLMKSPLNKFSSWLGEKIPIFDNAT